MINNIKFSMGWSSNKQMVLDNYNFVMNKNSCPRLSSIHILVNGNGENSTVETGLIQTIKYYFNKIFLNNDYFSKKLGDRNIRVVTISDFKKQTSISPRLSTDPKQTEYQYSNPLASLSIPDKTTETTPFEIKSNEQQQKTRESEEFKQLVKDCETQSTKIKDTITSVAHEFDVKEEDVFFGKDSEQKYNDFLCSLYCNNGIGITKAVPGRCTVFLPENLHEVVVKDLNEDRLWGHSDIDYVSYNQLDKVKCTKTLVKRCTKKIQLKKRLNDMQSSALVVPRTVINVSHGSFLVEKKLDINTNEYHNYHLYHSNPNVFDKAVSDMVTLFSTSDLLDLVNPPKSQDFFCYTTNQSPNKLFSHVRYDNMPLYIEKNSANEEEGRIGLIDSESFQYDDDPESLKYDGDPERFWYNNDSDHQQSPEEKLLILVRIFPRHLNLIKDRAKLLKMNFDEKKLNSISTQAMAHYKYLYTDHADWLKHKNANHKDYLTNFKINKETKKKLVFHVEKNISSLESFKQLGGNTKLSPPKIANDLVYLITGWMETRIKEKLESAPKNSEGYIAEPDIIKARSLILNIENEENTNRCHMNYTEQAYQLLKKHLPSVGKHNQKILLKDVMELCFNKMAEDNLLFRVQKELYKKIPGYLLRL